MPVTSAPYPPGGFPQPQTPRSIQASFMQRNRGLGIIGTIGLLLAGLAAIAGCTIAPSKCTSGNCVVTARNSGGQLILQGSDAPSYPPPSFPAAAEAECNTVGGEENTYDLGGSGGPYTYSCDHVYYVGPDGINDYYTDIPVSGNGTLGIAGTVGAGATESECLKGWYPDASTGNPAGIPGKWDSTTGLCLPTVQNDNQEQFSN